MEQGDIIRIVDVQRQTNYSDELLNVYHYYIQSMTTPAQMQVYSEDIAMIFYQTTMTYLLQLQSNQLRHTDIRMYNLSSPAEQASHSWPSAYVGVNDSDPMPANVGWSFKMNRYDAVVRNGRKSIPGVPEEAVVGGKFVATDYQTTVAAVSATISSPLIVNMEDLAFTAIAIIVRIPSNPGVVPTVYSPIVSAQFRGFGTQNSRKEL